MAEKQAQKRTQDLAKLKHAQDELDKMEAARCCRWMLLLLFRRVTPLLRLKGTT